MSNLTLTRGRSLTGNVDITRNSKMRADGKTKLVSTKAMVNKKKIIDIIGILILFIGFFLAFLPHAFHARVGLEQQTHIGHVITGMILVIAGLIILIAGNKYLTSS